MKVLLALSAAVMATFPSVLAAQTLPNDVVFTDTGAIEAPLTDKAGNADDGLKTATTRPLGNCIACHVATRWKDMPLPGNIGPDLTGVGTRYEEPQLRGILVNAKHTFPETVMPAFYNLKDIVRPGLDYTGKAATDPNVTILDAQQIEDIVALLKTFTEN